MADNYYGTDLSKRLAQESNGGLAASYYTPSSYGYNTPTDVNIQIPGFNSNTGAGTGVGTGMGTGTGGGGGSAPSWLTNAQAFGTLGLGLASFLDNKKTASLQRDALRQNLQLSRENQANLKALGASWNKGWSQ
jgi:hypothetical protein